MQPNDLTPQTNVRRGTGKLQVFNRSPVLFVFLVMAAAMALLSALGFRLNGDADDLFKMIEVRHLLDTRSIFDRIIPGIRQPEPYLTHWPWLADLPYAAVAALLSPLVGIDRAVAIAGQIVPLLLLLPALFLYERIVRALGFARPPVTVAIAAFFAFRSFFEFAPGRADYHNLQILCLLAALALVLSPHRRAAAIAGLVTAVALALSLEFAGFFALVTMVYAWEFAFSAEEEGASRLTRFGTSLALGGGVSFLLIVPPADYLRARCDMFSAPHGLALLLGGLSLALAPLVSRRRGRTARLAALFILGGLVVALLALLFPQCLSGPYAGVSEYVRVNQLGRLPQERSLLQLPDFVLSINSVSMTILFVGAIAPVVIAIRESGRDRALLIIALFSLLALLQAVAYFRYFRYLPLFSAIGLAFLLSAFFPSGGRLAALVTSRASIRTISKPILLLPGLGLTAALVCYHLVVPAAENRTPAAEFADGCELWQAALRYDWPADARAFATPLVGIHLLSQRDAPAVVAIPLHPASAGIEKVYRFLDPATPEPRRLLDETRATHVALCAWRGASLDALATRYPLAAGLMQGRPPSWLQECDDGAHSTLRIYSYRGASCPTEHGPPRNKPNPLKL